MTGDPEAICEVPLKAHFYEQVTDAFLAIYPALAAP